MSATITVALGSHAQRRSRRPRLRAEEHPVSRMSAQINSEHTGGEIPRRGAPKFFGCGYRTKYAYDGAARLTNAILGQGTAAWKFRFEYDGLQNMIGRAQQVPAGKGSLPIQSGTYRYGENGFGPRQLTSVAHDCDDLLSTYHYDGAGRLDKDGKKNLAYDGYDQLTNVTDNGTALVSHAYGYDGLRTYTKGAGNTEQYWFASEDTLQPGGTTRWHYVKVGDRLVARQSFTHPSSPGSFPPAGATVVWWPRIEARAPRYFVTITAAAALLLLAWAGWRRRRPLWQTAPAVACSVALVLATPACDDVELRRQGVEDTSTRRYFHQGVAAGPTLITDGGGNVVDERRSEPFGQPIDANMALDPYNSLNKETNKETGWSYHGARWMMPQTARWTAPDPAVKGPDAKSMGDPWGMNPYSYVKQNPTVYWDPNGKYDELVHGAGTYQLAAYAGFNVAEAAKIALSCASVDYTPDKAPTFANELYGTTQYWHFDVKGAPGRFASAATAYKTSGDFFELENLGFQLHTLEDVGFKDAPGPHARGLHLEGDFALHGIYGTERSGMNWPWSRTTDIASANPEANRKQLVSIFEKLVEVAQSREGAGPVDRAAAMAVIDRIVKIRTRDEEREFMNAAPTKDSPSYADVKRMFRPDMRPSQKEEYDLSIKE